VERTRLFPDPRIRSCRNVQRDGRRASSKSSANPAEASEVGARVLPENNKAGASWANPEDAVSKVFGLHRDGVFSSFALSEPVVELVAQLIAPDIDVFPVTVHLSRPQARGDSRGIRTRSIFPFEPPRPVVGVLAGRDGGHPRQRLPPRVARVPGRTDSHARAGSAAGRQPTAISKSSTTIWRAPSQY